MRDEIRREVFETMILPHLRDLQKTALWLVRNRPDAERLVQMALNKAYGLWHPLFSQPACRVLIFKVLTGLYFGGIRCKPALLRINNNGCLIKESSNDRLTSLTEVPAGSVNRAIVRLPIEIRFVRFLSKLGGFSSRGIAEIIGLKVDTIEFISYRVSKLLQVGSFIYGGRG